MKTIFIIVGSSHHYQKSMKSPRPLATAAAEPAYKERLAIRPKPDDLQAYMQSLMFDPVYQESIE
ncbi:hypothetical protein [Desulfobulbus oligotrophicus]|uniref:Uncharacterized protein n=1 Tax=Desulfobulbus oligotrophicus TaxID=1909699 RepID=A0A7T5VE58_9BACT|nr:hypothetical protein [Desulfobulbus oligotrophicus]QQG66237.1 hypothetical protein HP555_10385 [Desulfobulbus oligotrophicus]